MLEVNYEIKENIKVVRFSGELEINVIEKWPLKGIAILEIFLRKDPEVLLPRFT